MKFIFALTALLIFSGCASTPKIAKDEFEIIEINPNKWTSYTKQSLEQLQSVYDLSSILVTNKIFIQSKTAPKPFPQLTLNTRFAQNPNKLLSLLVHAELYWWERKERVKFDKARLALSKSYPKLEKNKLTLLLICYLEFEALDHYLGKKEAINTIRSKIKEDKAYPWYYEEVLTRGKRFEKIVEDHNLSPIYDFKIL